MQEWRKRSFPHRWPPENTPRPPAELKEQGKAKDKVLWSWRKENNVRNYEKNPNFSLPAGSRRRKRPSRRRKSRRRPPAGLKWEEKLKKRYHEVEEERQPENPPLLPQFQSRRKIWPPPPPCNPPEKEKNWKSPPHAQIGRELHGSMEKREI